MKPYGIRRQDLPYNCTDHGKYGSIKMRRRCSCLLTKRRQKRSHSSLSYKTANKSRKAKERQYGL